MSRVQNDVRQGRGLFGGVVPADECWREEIGMDFGMADGSVIEGGCFCGAVRYRVTGTPRASTLCHCRSCRRACGAPTLAWLILNARDFHIVAGEPERFRSSDNVTRQFCPRCGTQLTYQNETQPDTIDITTASLDVPDAYPPTKEIWLEHRIAWESTNTTADHYARSSVGASPLPKTG